MKNWTKIFGVAALVGLLAYSAPAAQVTITNRGEVMVVDITPVSGGEVADTTIVQDNSVYAPKLGQRGSIVRTYDVSLGGAVGVAYKLEPPITIPSNAIVIGGYVDVNTAVTPATNTLSIGLNSAADLLAATTNLSVATKRPIIPVWTVATSVEATNAVYVTVTPAVAPVTAGRFTVVLDYFQGQ
jgi:hypothetical protein